MKAPFHMIPRRAGEDIIYLPFFIHYKKDRDIKQKIPAQSLADIISLEFIKKYNKTIEIIIKSLYKRTEYVGPPQETYQVVLPTNISLLIKKLKDIYRFEKFSDNEFPALSIYSNKWIDSKGTKHRFVYALVSLDGMYNSILYIKFFVINDTRYVWHVLLFGVKEDIMKIYRIFNNKNNEIKIKLFDKSKRRKIEEFFIYNIEIYPFKIENTKNFKSYPLKLFFVTNTIHKESRKNYWPSRISIVSHGSKLIGGRIEISRPKIKDVSSIKLNIDKEKYTYRKYTYKFRIYKIIPSSGLISQPSNTISDFRLLYGYSKDSVSIVSDVDNINELFNSIKNIVTCELISAVNVLLDKK